MKVIPLVYRPINDKLQLAMDYGSNRAWLRQTLGSGVPIQWDGNQKRWLVARKHLFAMVEASARKFGTVDVYLDYKSTMKCDKRCEQAKGVDCVCSCLGQNHRGGSLMLGWIQVGETTLIATETKRRHMRISALDLQHTPTATSPRQERQ